MATVREGNQGVLLIVDAQVGVMSEAWDAPRASSRTCGALSSGRAPRACR